MAVGFLFSCDKAIEVVRNPPDVIHCQLHLSVFELPLPVALAVRLTLEKEFRAFRSGRDADNLKQQDPVFANVIVANITFRGWIVFDAQLVGDPLASPLVINPGISLDECEGAAADLVLVVVPLALLLTSHLDDEAAVRAVSPLVATRE